jgi:hypothetical protein
MKNEVHGRRVTSRRIVTLLWSCIVLAAGSAACSSILGFEPGTLAEDEAGLGSESGAGIDGAGLPGSEAGLDGSIAPGVDAANEGGNEGGKDAEAGAEAGLDAGVDAGPKQAFETALTFNGRLDKQGVAGVGGLAAGDARCMEAAQAAFPGRTFVAWLSTAGTSAASRLVGGGPWYVGNTFLGTYTDVTTSKLKTMLHSDPTGAAVGSPLGVWTGTNGMGTAEPGTCNDWTSNTAAFSGEIGTGGGGADTWTYATQRSCDTTYHLYCFEK